MHWMNSPAQIEAFYEAIQDRKLWRMGIAEEQHIAEPDPVMLLPVAVPPASRYHSGCWNPKKSARPKR
jgi:hypothetical protein